MVSFGRERDGDHSPSGLQLKGYVLSIFHLEWLGFLECRKQLEDFVIKELHKLHHAKR